MGTITVSRSHGSGGATFAEALAKKLGYRCVSRGDMEKWCREGGSITCALPEEESPSFLEMVGDLLSNRNFYKAALMACIYESALTNGVVFVGMGAHLVLSGVPDVIPVRVVRSLPERVKAIARLKTLSYEYALDLIEERDGKRNDFIEHYFDADLNDATQYHLTINSTFVSLDHAVELVAGYARVFFSAEKTEEKIDVLKKRLLEKRAEMLLFGLGLVHDYAKTSFEAQSGGLLLVKGVIGGEHEKKKLFDALQKLEGVKKVEDHLKVGILSHIIY
jgi:cytidylate kinase